jgi:hypothetical protein
MHNSATQFIHRMGYFHLGDGRHIAETMLEQAQRVDRVRALVLPHSNSNRIRHLSMKEMLIRKAIPIEIYKVSLIRRLGDQQVFHFIGHTRIGRECNANDRVG